MKKIKYLLITIVLFVSLVLATQFSDVAARPAQATAPGLGSAAGYSVLGATTVTNSGPTTLSDNLGVYPGSEITGLAQITVGGKTNIANGYAHQAKIDASAAVGSITGQANTGGDVTVLDSLTLEPGVYDMGAGSLSGTLTLDGEGVYLFRASSSLTSSGSVNFINGARACDVYWYVPTLVTLSGGSFAGTIIAGTGIHFNTNVRLDGRALAIGGDVTLLSNTITGPTCASAPLPTATAGPVVPTATSGPENPTSQPGVTATSVIGLPPSGGAPIQGETSPLNLLLIIGGFVVIAGIAGNAIYRNGHRIRK